LGKNDGCAACDALSDLRKVAIRDGARNAPCCPPDTEAEKDHLITTDGFPDWDYVPPDETAPFEYKASDWGWIGKRLVALTIRRLFE
jgi:hypothetical protein